MNIQSTYTRRLTSINSAAARNVNRAPTAESPKSQDGKNPAKFWEQVRTSQPLPINQSEPPAGVAQSLVGTVNDIAKAVGNVVAVAALYGVYFPNLGKGD